jgi:hypothetical protein
MATLELVELTMSKINMAKLTNEYIFHGSTNHG